MSTKQEMMWLLRIKRCARRRGIQGHFEGQLETNRTAVRWLVELGHNRFRAGRAARSPKKLHLIGEVHRNCSGGAR